MILIDEDKLYALLGATAKYAYNKGYKDGLTDAQEVVGATAKYAYNKGYKDGLTDAQEVVQGNQSPAHYDPDGMETKIQEVVREAREEVLRG